MKKSLKNYFFILAFVSLVFIPGCDLTPEAKVAVHEAAITADEEAKNFEAIKDKLGAKNPADADAIEQWKVLHSQALAANAKAMADLDTRVNGANAASMPMPTPTPAAKKKMQIHIQKVVEDPQTWGEKQ